MTTDPIGGVWRFTHELVLGLLHEGCDVALVSLGAEPSCHQNSSMAEIATRWPASFEFTATTFPLEWMECDQDAYNGATQFLSRRAEEFEAHLIHINQFCFGALPVRKPKIVTAHSDVLSWASSCRGVPLENSLWLRQYCGLVTQGLLGADAVVAPTKWMLKALVENFALPSGQHVIPNGCCMQVVAPVDRKLQAVTAGRLWDEGKNVALLYDVSARLPILVAGDQDGKSDVSTMRSGVRLLGKLSEKVLMALFQESAIYVCTSVYEPFGLAPLEAALCGCALLMNDIPSLREVWGKAALYYTDAASLTTLLEQLSENAQLLRQMQQLSVQRARFFSRERMSSAYLDVFQGLIAEAPRREVANGA